MRNPNRKKIKVFEEFKAFIAKGNAVQMAVGVIIASAFTAIVNSIVNGIFNPLIALVFSSLGISTEGLGWVINYWNPEVWNVDGAKNIGSCFNGIYNKDFAIYFDLGTLINAVLYFLVVAIILFSVVKIISTLQKKKKEYEAQQIEQYYLQHPDERPAPADNTPKPTELDLLIEIRDELKTLNSKTNKEEK